MSSETHKRQVPQPFATPGEPFIRIGVILARDARDVIRLRTAGVGARMETPLRAGYSLAARADVTIGRVDAGVELRATDGTMLRAERLSVRPHGEASTASSDGTLVRDVVAGRGFHWQRNIDQTLAGTLEILPAEGGLVLVNELPVETYLSGVISAEMSGACPGEFLRAQCVVARSWLLAATEDKHDADPFDRCNDDCCQRYQGLADVSPSVAAAVQGTRGWVLLNPRGEFLDANYAKSCGGMSETPWAVWGVEKPGLEPIVDAPANDAVHRYFPLSEENMDDYLDGSWVRATKAWCSPNVVSRAELERFLGRVDVTDDYFRWTVRYERAELEALLAEKIDELSEIQQLEDLRVVERGPGGRVSRIELDWIDRSGAVRVSILESEYHIREVLHTRFLYSSAIAVRREREADGTLTAITLRGAGWGHGVGMCQIGALGMALAGHSCSDICRHYYPASTLAVAYD